jgi:NTP pyrophosphatase (non-canonical NTP hydrolase)
LNIKELTSEIHQNAKDHGWWDEARSFGDIIALCHSELSEALDEFRNGKPMIYVDDKYFGISTDISEIENPNLKTEGIATEMADCIIRILDWAGKEGIDMEYVIKIKHEHNKTRPYRHGNKKI